MMGGIGSGRRSNRTKAEQCRTLNVNDLNRAGCLRDGYEGAWLWFRGGKHLGRINISYQENALTLLYRACGPGDGTWQDKEQTIVIESVGCRYGGERPYFTCPNPHCARRVLILYGATSDFWCRHCHSITYTSQSETQLHRLYRKANKLRLALGREDGQPQYLPDKPVGMWQRTYERRVADILEIDERADLACEAATEQFLLRYAP